jgi:hypothetical protein
MVPWFTCTLSFLLPTKELPAFSDAKSCLPNRPDFTTSCYLYCSKQEMELEECKSLLLDRVRLLHPQNPERIIAQIMSSKTPAEIRLLTSDGKIAPLIEEAQQFLKLPPLQPPKEWHGLRPFPHLRPQFHPVDRFQGIQAPFGWNYSWPEFHPKFRLHSPFPICSISFTQVAFLMNFRLHSSCPIHSLSSALAAFLVSFKLHYRSMFILDHCTLGCLSYIQVAIFMEFVLRLPPLVLLELFRAHLLNSLARGSSCWRRR